MMRFGLVVGCGMLLAACGGDDTSTSGGGGTAGTTAENIPGRGSAADATNGDTIFQGLCRSPSCPRPQGNHGQANAGDLPATVPGLSDLELATLLVDGQGSMPPQVSSSGLSEEEAADVIAYCRQTFQ